MIQLNLLQIYRKLEELKKPVFTPQDIKLLFNAKDRAVNGFLTYNSQKGKIIKLKRGLYAVKKSYISPYLIANMAYRPSYISFETALSYYHLIPETVYSVISATNKTSRDWTIQENNYIYRSLKKEAYTGYIIRTVENEQILIATAEKALADYCYFNYLGKIKEWNNRLELKNIDWYQVKGYLRFFGGEKLISFVKKYLPQL